MKYKQEGDYYLLPKSKVRDAVIKELTDYYAAEFVSQSQVSAPDKVQLAMQDDFIQDALNAYYHATYKELSRTDLGDIEKDQLIKRLNKSKQYLTASLQSKQP